MMVRDGVKNVVYVGYYNLKGDKAKLNNIVRVGNSRLERLVKDPE